MLNAGTTLRPVMLTLSLVASTVTITSTLASPYHTTGLDAADSFEFKIASEYESAGDDREIEGPALNVTIPVKPGIETSVTFGTGRAKEAGIPLSEKVFLIQNGP